MTKPSCFGDYWLHEGDTQYCCEDCDHLYTCQEAERAEDDESAAAALASQYEMPATPGGEG